MIGHDYYVVIYVIAILIVTIEESISQWSMQRPWNMLADKESHAYVLLGVKVLELSHKGPLKIFQIQY